MFVVEPARREHLPFVYDLARRTLTEQYHPDFFSDLLANEAGYFLICRPFFTATPIGFLAANDVTSVETRVLMVSVDRSWSGRGVGRQLMKEFLKEARLDNKLRVDLEVRTDNSSAIRFYEHFGFGVKGEVAGYYSDGSSALLMRKPL